MPRRTLDIVNRLGLHARVGVEKDGQSADGKSIMAVMMLAAAKGAQITVETEGPDADAALEAITELIADCFGEDD